MRVTSTNKKGQWRHQHILMYKKILLPASVTKEGIVMRGATEYMRPRIKQIRHNILRIIASYVKEVIEDEESKLQRVLNALNPFKK